MITQEFYDSVNQIISDQVEYETTHIDAGDSYAHLASEGDFDYHNGENRLVEYCEEMGINLTGIDIDKLAEDVIFWSYMTVGGDYDPQKRFLVASYNVGEVEVHVGAGEIGARFTPYLINKLNRETDAFWSFNTSEYAYAYVNLHDNHWDQVCNADVIQDLINHMRESSQ